MPAEASDLERVRALLGEQTTMVLSTTDGDGTPRCAPLFYLPGEDFELYWLSSRESAHSRNISRTGQAAVSVFAPVKRWRRIRGVQMQGTAEVVCDSQRERMMVAYRRRFRLGAALGAAITGSALYRFRPSWLRYVDNARGFGYKAEFRLPVTGPPEPVTE